MANRIKGITVEIGGDTTKLSKALEGVNKTIKNTQTQLKDVEKLSTTSDIVTDALTAFGLTAADSGHFADVLAAASSNANTNDKDNLG